MKLYWLAGNAMAARLDVGVGMLIASFLLPLLVGSGTPDIWWATAGVLLLGAFFAVFPDMDIIGPIIRGKKIYFDHHQTLLHRPIVTLTSVPLVLWICIGPFFALLAFLGILWHYVHDTPGGIAWLWPISTLYRGFTWTSDPEDGIPDPDYYARWLNQELFTLIEIALGMTFTFLALWISFGTIIPGTILIFGEVVVMSLVWHFWVVRKKENAL